MALIRLVSSKMHAYNEKIINVLRSHLMGQAQDPEPAIFIDENEYTHTKKMYVVWREWAKIPDERRAELILAAIDRTEGEHKALEYVYVMGLTPAEVRELGLTDTLKPPVG